MALLRNVGIRIYSTLFAKLIFRKAINELPLNDDATLIKKALLELTQKKFSEDEAYAIIAIEAVRKKLLKSRQKIAVIDYGAGKGDGKPSDYNPNGIESETTVGRKALSSKSKLWACLLFKIIRSFHPQNCLELGTNVGISASYQAAALKINRSGKITTLEGDLNVAMIATQTFTDLGLNNVSMIRGKFQDTLNDVLNKKGPFDYVFIDGHHDEQATQDYFKQILPHVVENGIIIFDDIVWSEGMKKAWQEIIHHKDVRTFVDLFVLGICVISRNPSTES